MSDSTTGGNPQALYQTGPPAPAPASFPVININILNGSQAASPVKDEQHFEWIPSVIAFGELLNTTILTDESLQKEISADGKASEFVHKAAVAMTDFKGAVQMRIGIDDIIEYACKTVAFIMTALEKAAEEQDGKLV